MSTSPLDLITNARAAGVITVRTGKNGAYWLADNRRGRHDYLVPHYRENGRVYYDSKVIDKHFPV